MPVTRLAVAATLVAVRRGLVGRQRTGDYLTANERTGPVVLIVENDPRLRARIQESLERLDFIVVCAHDHADARKVVEEHGADIDLAVIDLALPDGSGEALGAELLARYPAMKLVYTSGHPAEASRVPHDAILMKPFIVDAVAVLAKQILASERTP